MRSPGVQPRYWPALWPGSVTTKTSVLLYTQNARWNLGQVAVFYSDTRRGGEMRWMLLLACFGGEPSKEDEAIYAEAIQAAQGPEIARLEAKLEKQKQRFQNRKKDGLSSEEVKKLRTHIAASEKTLKELRAGSGTVSLSIDATSPRLGSVGALAIPRGRLGAVYRVEQVQTPHSFLLRATWHQGAAVTRVETAEQLRRRIDNAAARAGATPRGVREHGPLLLVTGIDTAGLADGSEWKPEGVFVVEPSAKVTGQTAIVLRRLKLNGR